MRRILAIIGVGLLVACDSGGTAERLDADSMDAAAVDAGIRDQHVEARLDLEAGGPKPMDAATDARVVPDVGHDGVVVDAFVADARPIDVGAPDAGPVDMWIPPPCEGIVRPQPASPDGSEVCNYIDDDGDGQVDEGFAYEFGPERLPLGPPQRLGILSPRLAAATGGYAAVWDSFSDYGIRLATVDASGCISRPPRIVTSPDFSPWPQSMWFAASHDRYALVYSTERQRGNFGAGYTTYVHVFDLQGDLVGEPIELTPDLAATGANGVAGMGDGRFGVFATTQHPVFGGRQYGAFAIIDRNGQMVGDAMHPFDTGAQDDGPFIWQTVGLAYGDGVFALAWGGNGVAFMIWDETGAPVVPPRYIGRHSGPSGITWNGTAFVIPHVDVEYLAFSHSSPMGESIAGSPITPPGEFRGMPAVYDVVTQGETTLADFQLGGRNRVIARFRSDGLEDAPRLRVRNWDPSPISVAVGRGRAPSLLVSDRDQGILQIARLRCRVE